MSGFRRDVAIGGIVALALALPPGAAQEPVAPRPGSCEQSILTLRGHQQWVSSIAYSSDGTRIVSGSGDDTVKVWDALTGKELLSWRTGGKGVTALALSADGKQIVTGHWNHSLQIWDALTGQKLSTLRGHAENITSVAISPDGKRIVSGSGDDTLKIWDAAAGKILHTLDHDNEYDIAAVAFSPDGKRIVSGDGDNVIKIWDAQSGEDLLTLLGHDGAITAVAFSPDGRLIASGSIDDTVRIWDAQSGKELMTLLGHTDDITAIAFESAGKRLASSSTDGTVRIWNAVSGKALATLRGHEGSVTAVAFNPAGNRLVSGGQGTLMIWAIESQKEDAPPLPPGPRGILKAEEVPDSPVFKAAQMTWSKDRLLIADRGNNRIVAFRPPGTFEDIRKIDGPGGVAIDARGSMIVATRNPDRLIRFGPDGEESLGGDRVGTPHHVLAHPSGVLFWSGFPDGGTRSLDLKGNVTSLKPSIGHTFGIALSPKRDALFVTSKLPDPGRRAVWRFPLEADGSVGRGEEFLKTGDLEPKFPDLPPAKDGGKSLLGWVGRVQGLAIDAHGNFYIAGAEAHTSGAAVAVVTPDGKTVRAMILGVPQNVSSLALGGPDGTTLYIVGSGPSRLYRVELQPGPSTK